MSLRIFATLIAIVALADCSQRDDLDRSYDIPDGAVAGTAMAEDCVHGTGEADYAAQCGRLIVAENREDPGSRLIALPYRRILAQTEEPGEPLFILNGGPGSSNMAFRRMVPWYVGERDIVLIGYRGIDGSVRLDCPEVDSAVRRGKAILSGAFVARLGAAFGACADRHTDSGVDLDGYTILEVADDVEALRRALGHERIDLLSISYGTRVAMVYGWRYPDNIARSAMVSVNPPGRFVYDPAMLDGQLRRYSDLCRKDAYCASRSDDLYADMEAALQHMPARWLGMPVDRDAVVLMTYMSLFSTDNASWVFDMWIAAADGDYSGMALVSLIAPYMLPADMSWGDLAAKGLSADYDNPQTIALAPGGGGALLGAPGNLIGLGASAGWPAHKIPDLYRSAQQSTVETLLLSGSLDVSTPAETAREALLPVMPNARQVVLAEFSHAGDLVYHQPEAARHLLTTFYASGTADASRFEYRPVDFDPGWRRLPLAAKGLAGLAAILVLLLLYAAGRLLSRGRRGKA